MDAYEGLCTHHLFRKLLQQFHFPRHRLQRLLLHLLLHLAGATFGLSAFVLLY
jgi:hypothetical protein